MDWLLIIIGVVIAYFVYQAARDNAKKKLRNNPEGSGCGWAYVAFMVFIFLVIYFSGRTDPDKHFDFVRYCKRNLNIGDCTNFNNQRVKDAMNSYYINQEGLSEYYNQRDEPGPGGRYQ